MNDTLPLLNQAQVAQAAPPEESGFGCLSTARGALPLRGLAVRADIAGLVAETTLRQTFVNAFDQPLEATYIFPLPDRAAVTRFRLEVGGRVVEGQLQEREQARTAYDQAIAKGQRAAITEEERPGVFTLRVGNLPPGQAATVELRLTGPLPFSDGEVTYRFPLVVAPRYIPGTPLPGPQVGDGTAPDTDAVPDASRITPPVLLPGYPNPVRLSIQVELDQAGLALGDYAASLPTRWQPGADGRLLFTVEPGERLDRDFVLRFTAGGDAVSSSLRVQPDAEGQGGTFALTVVPPRGGARTQRPRDIVFVLDRSGSMEGWKMTAARRALGRMVETLTERDRFTILAFDDQIETPWAARDHLAPATDHNRFHAVSFLERIGSRGGTEMAAPLTLAFDLLKPGESERMVVLLTDGQVGNEDQILRALATRVKGVRVFTLGIDTAVNEAFLRRLAGLGGGCTEVVESSERLSAVMDRVHRRLATPTLMNLKVVPAGMTVEPDSLTPARLPDLFVGTPLLVLGRYTGAPGDLRLEGQDEAAEGWAVTLRPTTAGGALSSLWARGRVRDLEDRYVVGGGDRTALEKPIVAMSLKYGVLCRFTAYLAVEVQEIVNPGGQVQRVTQPVELPADWAVPKEESLTTVGACLSAALPACAAPPASAPLRSRSLGRAFLAAKMTSKQAAPPPPASPPPTPPQSPAQARLEDEEFDDGVDLLADDFDAEEDEDLEYLAEAAPPKRKARAVPRKPAADYSAYRQRGGELWQRLRDFSSSDPALRRRELLVVAVQLDNLLTDLRSVGVPDVEVKPLADLLTELQALTDKAHAGKVDLAALWTRALDVLQHFATGTSPAAKRKRWTFWK